MGPKLVENIPSGISAVTLKLKILTNLLTICLVKVKHEMMKDKSELTTSLPRRTASMVSAWKFFIFSGTLYGITRRGNVVKIVRDVYGKIDEREAEGRREPVNT